jgi:hypothetical protein
VGSRVYWISMKILYRIICGHSNFSRPFQFERFDFDKTRGQSPRFVVPAFGLNPMRC